MKKIFIYTRSSTNKQEISCEAQSAIIHKYIEAHKEFSLKDYEIAGEFRDQAVSSNVQLVKRPEGERMMLNISDGDLIIASHLSRMFRKTAECVRFLDDVVARGINFIILDANFDTTTPTGRAFLQMMAVFAELEGNMIRERIKSAFSWKKANGLPVNRSPPRGWSVEGKRKDARFVPNHFEREVMCYYAYLHFCHNMSVIEVSSFARKNQICMPGTKAPGKSQTHYWIKRWKYFALTGEWPKDYNKEMAIKLKSHESSLNVSPQQLREEYSKKAAFYAPIQRSSDSEVPSPQSGQPSL